MKEKPLDPLGHRTRLRMLTARPEYAAAVAGPTDAPAARAAALMAAVSRGWCLLAGAVGESAPLPPAVIENGSAAAGPAVDALLAQLGGLADRVDAAESQFEIDAIVVAPLRTRADLHAAAAAARETVGPDAPATGELDRRGADLDAALRENLDLISLAADTYLLDNWRALVLPEHAAGLWWLSGEVEAARDAARLDAEAGLPTADWWADLAVTLDPRSYFNETTAEVVASTSTTKPPAPPAEGRSLVTRATAEYRHPVRWGAIVPQAAMAAATPAAGAPTAARFVSPDGTVIATVRVPAVTKPSGETPLVVLFEAAGGDDATREALVGTTCRLGGAPIADAPAATVEEVHGAVRAAFVFEKVRDTLGPTADDGAAGLRLRVDDADWPVVRTDRA
ncbi:hypothetical protein [Alienimonas californiensis]|uniref:Uncharacterized protein n=1 Tax=Alienimonas californiensis TaxID=2527989 RepID=A0A517P6Q9_9PLAN|nr:hypothetical protein [Alienimonas californiensis]QDT15054.1 hypothetical protein CA12_11340 [Alienimonas californiensis]